MWDSEAYTQVHSLLNDVEQRFILNSDLLVAWNLELVAGQMGFALGFRNTEY